MGAGLATAMGLALHARGLSGPICWTAAITLMTAVWWVTEAIPLPAASLVPFALFPLTGVMTAREAASGYGEPTILLLLGGFLISSSLEKTGTHTRLALGIIRLLGGAGGRRMVLGFMSASAMLSMWISNSATVLMLLPIALAVIQQAGQESRQRLLDATGGAAEEGDEEWRAFGVALLLGIAYAASIGGVGTPIGTPPNVYFKNFFQNKLGRDISFLEWMKLAVPIVVIMIPATWWVLTRKLPKGRPMGLPVLGPWRKEEVRVLVVFTLTAMAWVFRDDLRIELGDVTWRIGWQSMLSDWMGRPLKVDDTTVALFFALVLFIMPDGKNGRLLDWSAASKIPWGLLLLFGGGLVISNAFDKSGLSLEIGKALAGLDVFPVLVIILMICFGMVFLTEITTNAAITALSLPILAEVAKNLQGQGLIGDPLVILVPAVISASCAFMMPMGTPPNAIVFGTGMMRMKQMVMFGVWLNLIAIAVITLVCWGLLM